MSTQFYRIFPLIILSFLLISCSNGGNTPENAAEDWFIAVNKMESLEADGMTCVAHREELRQQMNTGSAFLVFGELLLGDIEIELDTSEVNFETVDQNNDQAIVHVRGELRGSIAGSVYSEEVDERFLMLLEDGEWRYCGYPGNTNVGSLPDPTSTPAALSEPEQIAAQAVLYEIFDKEGISQFQNIHYETIDISESRATVAAFFDSWDDNYQIWRENTKILLNARYISGQWNVDSSNYEIISSPETEATVAAIDQSIRESAAQEAETTAATYNSKVGGIIVFSPVGIDLPDYDIPYFGVIDQEGNRQIIFPQVPQDYYSFDSGPFALSPAGDTFYFSFAANTRGQDGYTAIYSSDLTGNNVNLISRLEDPNTEFEQMIVSPDNSRLAISAAPDFYGGVIHVLNLNDGSWQQIYESGDINIGPLTWSSDSSELFMLASTAYDAHAIYKVDAQNSTLVRDLGSITTSNVYWNSLILTPDGKDFIFNISDSSTPNGIVMISKEGNDTFFIQDGDGMCHLQLSANGERLLFSDNGTLTALNLLNGEKYPATTIERGSGVGTSCVTGEFDWAEN